MWLGIGLITIPYTLSQAGWSSLALLMLMAAIMCYTGLLLKWCMDLNQTIKSYPDIAYSAFGRKGRVVVLAFVYSDLFLAASSFLILEGDNLHRLFPNVGFQFGGHRIGGAHVFTLLSNVRKWKRTFGNMRSLVF